MVVATVAVRGLEVLPSDDESTVVGVAEGSEPVPELGGEILWFTSAREILAQ
jgi:hypothetical protein